MVLEEIIILFGLWKHIGVITHFSGELKILKFRKCTKLEQLLLFILQKIERDMWIAPAQHKGRIGKTDEQYDTFIRSWSIPRSVWTWKA